MTSGPAQCAAQQCTGGTLSTINSLIMTVGNIGGRVLQNNQQQKALAVKSQAQLQAQKTSSAMWLALAFIALIGLFLYQRGS